VAIIAREVCLMPLSDEQREYLAGRNRLVKRWPAVGAGLLAAIALVLLFLHSRSPLLINPLYTTRLIETGGVPDHTMAEMAAKLPVVFLVCCGLLVAVVLFQFAVMANERRLLGLIDELAGEDGKTAPEEREPDDGTNVA
jgi:hypothetical protein